MAVVKVRAGADLALGFNLPLELAFITDAKENAVNIPNENLAILIGPGPQVWIGSVSEYQYCRLPLRY